MDKIVIGNNKIGKYQSLISLFRKDFTYYQDKYNSPIRKTTIKQKAGTITLNYTQSKQ